MAKVVRAIGFAVILLAGLVIIKKKSVSRKKISLLALVVADLVLFVLSSIFPPENLFVTFDSLESLAKYHGAERIAYVVEVEESYYITYEEGENSYSSCLAVKVDGGYKIAPSYMKIQILENVIHPGAYERMEVCTVIGTGDRYFGGYITPDNKTPQLAVVDADGNMVDCKINVFMPDEDNDSNYYFMELCIYVNAKNWMDELYLVIDGEKAPLT